MTLREEKHHRHVGSYCRKGSQVITTSDTRTYRSREKVYRRVYRDLNHEDRYRRKNLEEGPDRNYYNRTKYMENDSD